MKNEGLKTLTNEEEQDLGRRTLGNEAQSEKERFCEVKRQDLSREIRENERKDRADRIYRNS